MQIITVFLYNILNEQQFSVSRATISIDRRGGEVMDVFNASVPSAAFNAVHNAALHTFNIKKIRFTVKWIL